MRDCLVRESALGDEFVAVVTTSSLSLATFAKLKIADSLQFMNTLLNDLARRNGAFVSSSVIG